MTKQLATIKYAIRLAKTILSIDPMKLEGLKNLKGEQQYYEV